MADDATTPEEEVEVVIPEETKKKFPDLVAMTMESKSMNNQERNYWLQVLPVMTEPQVAELRDILESEKKKLAEIEKKYAKKEPPKELTPEEIAAKDAERKKARDARIAQEKKAQSENNPDDILSQLNFA